MIRLSPLPLLATLAVLAACGPKDPCTPQSTRCLGNLAQVCGADGRYRDLADCNKVSEQSGVPFACAYLEEDTPDGPVRGHTCLPAGDTTSTAGTGGSLGHN